MFAQYLSYKADQDTNKVKLVAEFLVRLLNSPVNPGRGTVGDSVAPSIILKY